jgi:hypothetical protein
MSALAYAALSVLPATSESAPFWSIVLAVVFSAVGPFFWQPSEAGGRSPRKWVLLLLAGWLFSAILFLVACWLRDVPLREALTFPPALWERRGVSYWYHRPFWWAVCLGPGLTLLAIGSVIRLGVLRLRGAPLTRA